MVTAFTVSVLFRENQQGGKIPPHPTQIRVGKKKKDEGEFLKNTRSAS